MVSSIGPIMVALTDRVMAASTIGQAMAATTTGPVEVTTTITISGGITQTTAQAWPLGLAIGTYVYNVPPNYLYEEYGGLTYRRCGDVWYQPRYEDVGVRFVVVKRPH